MNQLMTKKFNKASVLAAIVLTISPMPSEARKTIDMSCGFINENAFNNEADCKYGDTKHQIVTITPTRKISSKKAAQWVKTAAIALAVGGERGIKEITVSTSPSWQGEYATAKETEEISLRQATQLQDLIMICTVESGWGGIATKENPTPTPPRCRKAYK